MPPGLFNPFQLLGRLPIEQNPFSPAYTDPNKPMPGESQLEWDARRALITGVNSVSDIFTKGQTPMAAGAKAAEYVFGPAKPPAAAAKPKVQPQVKPTAVFDNSIAGLTDSLINRGIPGHVARGVAAGLLAESAGDPNAFNSAGGGQGAFGLSQWRGPRQAALKARYGDNPTPDQQLDFLVHELKGGDQGGASVMAARTPQEALQSFVHNFLRPGEGAFGDLKRGFAAMGQDIREVLGQNMVNPFDPSYANMALGEIGKSQQAALTPTQINFQGSPMPEVPEVPDVPKTDFSQADAALEALRPVELSIKEAEGMRWKNFWGSLGQAMMSSPEGEGLGSFFLRLGGGALASVGSTMSEIQARKDQYDIKLAKWQAALYEHDLNKAQTVQRELMLDWQNDANRAMESYKQGMEVWSKTAVPTVRGNNLEFLQLDPKTGKGSVVIQPIESLVNSAYAMERANVYSNAFGVENQANAQVAGVMNRVQGSVVMAQAGQVLADQNASPQEKAAAASFGPISAINYAIDTGQISSVVGEDEAEALNEDVMKNLAGAGIFPGQKGYEEAYRKAATGRLLAYTMQSPETLERLMATMGPASDIFNAYDRYQSRVERQTTNSKGQVTNQVTFGDE